ncbi:MAG: hypothetical protein COY80_03615 [Candidatus Pacebacteria bacterium CG_4_10_14_0_8_um_filter_42_14]|nr:MAG: hypothetical protein COY80_03615 [Candidatus Pacebacteria bacterium CG_4_10_14_0_8_um_filter_42_14]
MKFRILSLVVVVLFAGVFSFSAPSLVQAQNKCGINVGPYYEEAPRVHDLTQEGGWLVALGTNGDCGKIENNVFGQGLNVVLRGYNNGRPFTKDEAFAWVATLGKLDTKGQKVFFMPWNEPNHDNEGGGDNAARESYMYVNTLKEQLEASGLLNTKVVLLSPMVNKLHPNYEQFFSNGGLTRDEYYGLASGSSINEYDQALSLDYKACVANSSYDNNCRYGELNLPNQIYALESGVTGTNPGGNLHYRDNELIEMLNKSWGDWAGDSKFEMFAIFSYDPHVPGDWNLYTAPQVTNFYRNKCEGGSVQRTTISQDQIMEDGSKFQKWMSANENKLVECSESCGYAPKSKQDLCGGVGRGSKEAVSTFHVSPISNLVEGRSVDKIREDLIRQGYQAYCASPERAVSAEFSGEVEKYFEQSNNDEFKLSPIFSLNLGSSEYPMFRDTQRKYELKSDYEGYWTFQEDSGQTYSHSELGSAPIESLLTEDQRCAQGINNLLAQDEMCKKLVNPDTCALYEQKIPNTSYALKELLEAYSSSNPFDKTPREICSGLQQSKVEIKKQLFRDFTQVPLTIEKGYRLGFVVISIEEIKDINPLFSFFANKSDPRDEVLVVAFRIPDVITNKPLEGSYESGAYPVFSDGAMLTRDSLLSTEQQTSWNLTKNDTRQVLLDKSAEMSVQKNELEIFCAEGENKSEGCRDDLVKALTDIINAEAGKEDFSCVLDSEIDNWNTIADSAAALTQSPRSQFQTQFGNELLSSIFSTISESTEVDSAQRSFESLFVVNGQTRSGKDSQSASVKMYLVYPVGYELESVTNVLKASFLTKDQIAELEKDEDNNKRFELYNGVSSLSKDSHESRFPWFSDDGSICGRENGSFTKCMTTSLEYAAKPVQVLGAKFGYYLRAIQRTLAKKSSNVQNYLASCETVEEFLLDRCAGVGEVEPQQSLTYCRTPELSVTNSTLSNIRICMARDGECKELPTGAEGYFLDRKSPYRIQFASRFIDGATLLTTNEVVAVNPGQGKNEYNEMGRCTGPFLEKAASVELWHLPANTPKDMIKNEGYWSNHGTRLVIITAPESNWTNVVASLQVKPGYYVLKNPGNACLMNLTEYINYKQETSKESSSGTPSGKVGVSLIPIGMGSTDRTEYCAINTKNSRMPGGSEGLNEQLVVEGAAWCKLEKPGYNLALNNSCGGNNGSGSFSMWSEQKDSDKLNLKLYEKLFGKPFTIPPGIPSDDQTCENLFPNVIKEVPCDEVNNTSVGSVANFGKDVSFDIEYWNEEMTTFSLPSQELWSTIKDAEARHSCDPLLVLAVAHSESRTYTNHKIANGAGALGVFQFTPGSWNVWKTYQPAAVTTITPQQKCAQGLSQPPTFTESVKNSLDFSSPTNIKAAADSACRLIMWTGMQNHPNDNSAFVNAFAVKGENSYGQIWNGHKPQADYVWRLWQRLREETEKDAVAPPINYPYPCDTPA